MPAANSAAMSGALFATRRPRAVVGAEQAARPWGCLAAAAAAADDGDDDGDDGHFYYCCLRFAHVFDLVDLVACQLDVKGCKDIHESFAKYVEEEVLDGDNK